MPHWYFLVLATAFLLLCVLVSPVLATRKGYAWYLWVFAAGPLGLIVLAFLPFARASDGSSGAVPARRTGNTIGASLSVVGVFAIVAALIWFQPTLDKSAPGITISTPQIRSALSDLRKSQEEVARMKIDDLLRACELYRADHDGAWPPRLAVLVEKDDSGGPYLKGRDYLLDPWGVEYKYTPPGPNSTKPSIWCETPGGQGGQVNSRN